ncbi:MAG: monovalent cation/H(+) antiporter subunit G [Lachnospiraceae bacterium]|nr:monovalent cation/H(+) antiporter subunit G [Lachnospiraceae bacterium]
MVEWIQFVVGAVLLLLGLGIFAVEMIGVYRFKYVLNRMHAAAMGDTLGIGFCLVGLIVMNGLNLTSLKLFFVVCFLWFSSPTSSHLIARLEVTTDTEREKHYREISLNALGEELHTRGEVEKVRTGVEENDFVQISESVTGETDAEMDVDAFTSGTGSEMGAAAVTSAVEAACTSKLAAGVQGESETEPVHESIQAEEA